MLKAISPQETLLSPLLMLCILNRTHSQMQLHTWGLGSPQDLPTGPGVLSHCGLCLFVLQAGRWLPSECFLCKTCPEQLTGHITGATAHPWAPTNCIAAFPAMALLLLGAPEMVPSPAGTGGSWCYCLPSQLAEPSAALVGCRQALRLLDSL